MSKQRDQALQKLCRDIKDITGNDIEATWKDADPACWRSMPIDVAQHRLHYCMAVKSDAERCRRCNDHCNDPRTRDDRARLVTCPFGVTEMRIPVLIGGQYRGSLSLSPWRGKAPNKLPAALHKSQQQLKPRNDNLARSLTRMIEARLLQILLSSDEQPRQSNSGSKHAQRLQRCHDYIDEHLQLQLRAASVARYLQLSPSRFIHWFKEAGGQPYRSYLQRQVLKEAARLLAQSQRSITDIALDLGYHTPSAFAAAFKKQYGIQPSQFRKSVRERI